MRRPILSLRSPSHSLMTSVGKEKERGMYHARATFQGHTVDMDRDLIILVESEATHLPTLILERSDEGSTAAMLTFVPRMEDLDTIISAEVIFLIDCSGSMDGESIHMAKEALRLFIHSLPADTTFNIVRFGSTAVKLFPSSRKYDDQSLEAAR